jgi:isopenicillin N synthase-like dioxygenase
MVKNHGIAEETINKIHDAAHKYFALPLEAKMETYMGTSKVCIVSNFQRYLTLTKLDTRTFVATHHFLVVTRAPK